MKIKFLSKTIITSLVASTILLSGCSKGKSKAEVVEEKPKVVQQTNENVKEVPAKKIVYTKYDSVVDDVFKDIAKIGPEGKYMLLVFGTNTDPYTDRFKS